MIKKRFLSILVLLCLTVSGAWAGAEPPLITIESTGDNASFTSGSKTFDNIATVTFSGNVENSGDDWGWFFNKERTLTVTAAEGYTITRVKFYNKSGSAFDEEAPFEAILAWDINAITKVNGTSIGTCGVTKIEVYGYATPTYKVSVKEGTEDATSWQGKAGTGEYQALPLEGVAAGTAVTVKYDGRKRVRSVKAVKKGGALGVPLTMEALTDGTIEVYIMDVGGARRYDFLDDYPESSKRVPVRRGSSDINRKYSVNNGEKTLIDMGITTIEVKAGDKVQFYGNGIYGGDIMVVLMSTAQTKVYGNIMSMIDETGYATLTTLQDQPGAFMATFFQNANLIDASGLLLPATTLANGCYWGMFQGCTSLTAAPELPATELAEGCYSGMFSDCTSLTPAPALPATELAEECYSEMFQGCTSLTTAPTLPATELATRCYNYMFNGCSNLNSITCLATEGINENESTYDWVNSVASTGTFTKASGATWPTGSNGIPSGWTVNEQ